MLVGTKEIEFSELKKACRSHEALLKFTTELVPTPLQHIQEVVNNQKYLVALHVREIKSLPWKVRNKLCEELLEGTYITGVPTALYDYVDILLEIDRDAFLRYLEEDERNAAR